MKPPLPNQRIEDLNVIKFAAAFALGAIAISLALVATMLLFALAEYLRPNGDVRMFSVIAVLIALVGIEVVIANIHPIYKWGARTSLISFAVGAIATHFYGWPF